MLSDYDIKGMVQKIQTIKKNVEELKQISGDIVAVDRNVNRLSASIRVLELDVCDVAEILLEKE